MCVCKKGGGAQKELIWGVAQFVGRLGGVAREEEVGPIMNAVLDTLAMTQWSHHADQQDSQPS